MKELSPRVARVLSRSYPSYHEPLAVARQWNRGTSPDRDDIGKVVPPDVLLADAAELLEVLTRKKYPTALCVWFEEAFNRVRRIPREPGPDRVAAREQALERLQFIDALFGGRLDEDTYSLWGRCYKDAGHEHLDRGLGLPTEAVRLPAGEREPASPLAQSGEATAAEAAYLKAETQYEKGYKLALNWFPGINVAFLRFMRAALAAELGRTEDSARLLCEAQTQAGEVLTATKWALKLPDDAIWHEATRGEAHALRGEWPEARARYRAALAQPGLLPYHPQSIVGQLRRILQGWKLLGRPLSEEQLTQLREVFGSAQMNDLSHSLSV